MLTALAISLFSDSSRAADDTQASSTPPTLEQAARKYFPSDVNAPSPKRIFRLTRDQIDATVASLLPGIRVRSVKEVMPRDPLQTNYEYADLLSFNAANTGGLAGWIGEIAAEVRKKPRDVIDCGEADAACADTKVRAFALKAFRGDVADEKLGKIATFYAGRIKGAGFGPATGDLVEVVLNSPDFLFRKEVDLDADKRLAPPQLLQSLTYTLADAPPDRLRLSSADAARHLSGLDALQTLDAISSSKESRDKLMRFFLAWLEVKEPGELTISRETFPEFQPAVATAMIDDTKRFLRTALARPKPRLDDITQARVPAPTTKLADAAGADRTGIFAQPGVLASHSGPTDTRPIKRGVFWVRKAMCMELEPAPKDLHAKLYEMTGKSERERIEKTTRQAACVGCHKIINPFAFMLESYDALGRFRTADKGIPIDPAVDFNFLDEGPASVETTAAALKTLTGSMMFKQCFVRQLFRFYAGRQEDAGDDPLLRRMFLEFAKDDAQDIVGALQTLASSNRMIRRQ